MCEALSRLGTEVHLATAVPAGSEEVSSILPADPVHTQLIEESGLVATTLRSPVGFFRRLQTILKQVGPDVIHDHGAWLPSNIASAWMSWRHDIPLIISPRGMLTDWSLSHRARKKAVAWHAYQKRVLAQANCFHVTAEAEAEGLRNLGFAQPAAVIPNAVSMPDRLSSHSGSGQRRALFLSRLHPKKGIPMLLEAWAEVRPETWMLELVGPSEDGHRAGLEAQARQLDITESVRFSGPVDDSEKWMKYKSADLFVLPSHSENFGIVVAEALAAGIPVITTRETPWQELEQRQCGWWTEATVDALVDALREAVTRSDEDRRSMGEAGRALVEEKYSWAQAAEKMRSVYAWMKSGGQPPSCLRRFEGSSSD